MIRIKTQIQVNLFILQYQLTVIFVNHFQGVFIWLSDVKLYSIDLEPLKHTVLHTISSIMQASIALYVLFPSTTISS